MCAILNSRNYTCNNTLSSNDVGYSILVSLVFVCVFEWWYLFVDCVAGK